MSNGIGSGVVEPRVAARLLKLITNGNKYAAGVTSLGAQDVGSSSARSSRTHATTASQLPDRREVHRPAPVHEGNLAPRGRGLEDELEDDVEDDEIEDLDRVLPADVTPDEAFEEEPDELDEP